MRTSTYWLKLFAVAALYVGAGKLGLLAPAGHPIVTLVWAPAGIALAAVALWGFRMWPALVAGAFVVNATSEAPLGVAVATAVGNPLEALAGAWLLRRAGFRAELDRPRDVVALAVLAAGLSTTIAATVGAGALRLAGQVPTGGLAQVWLDWWLGDAMGVLVVAPLLLVWTRGAAPPARFAEAAALAASLAAAASFVFLGPAPRDLIAPLPFVVFPFLMWAALRFGPAGASASVFLAVAIAVAGTLAGAGPFGVADPRLGLAWSHAYMAVAAVSSLLLAAALAERAAAQAELARTEMHARHAQKMEALGHLAGGVAHEFNNLLTVIRGYGAMLASSLGASDPRRGPVDELLRASERAADITRRMLAFGRRQPLEPVVVDLNEIVRGTGGLLKPLLGERIQLDFELDREPRLVRADPGQLEQVLVNLAVNARDAMPDGGRLAISCLTVSLDAADAAARPALRPGSWICLRVADTGRGMDAAVRARLFEPFFTTKEVGKGTGLGLASVYGIVSQSGGHIEVDSAPGRGAAFTLWLPALPPGLHATPRPPRPAPPPRGTETILVVEDELGVRSLVRSVLREQGYTVLEAANAAEAVDLAARTARVDLLLTDVVMPGMNGPELANQVTAARPGMKVLFMSGYSDGALERSQVDPARLLAKPFLPEALATRVRKELDAK